MTVVFLLVLFKHRCLQAWAYQGNAWVDEEAYTSKLVQNRLQYCRKINLSEQYAAMPRHTLFSTGATVFKYVYVLLMPYVAILA